MNEDLFDSEERSFNETEGRPSFLTVLIVLTWIAVAGGVIGSALSLINTGTTADQMEQSMSAFDSFPDDNPLLNAYIKDARVFYEVTLANMAPINLSNLVIYLIEGFAALLMFNLRKIGYWIYLACQLGFLLMYFVFYPSDNIMTTVTLVFSIFTSLLFGILYGVNVKHLKN